MAVTKAVTSQTAAELARLGQVDLGESRADELERKAESLARWGVAARWHFVGHVQSNKARRVVQRADVIHSVDSLGLLATIDRLAAELGRSPAVYLQVKLHPEPEKSGLAPAELAGAVSTARALRHVSLRGLMTMAPLVEGSESARVQAARQVFEGLAALARTLDGRDFQDGRVRLSMGMSDDFEIAILAGADCVRIGTSLFEGLPGAPAEARSTEGPIGTASGPAQRTARSPAAPPDGGATQPDMGRPTRTDSESEPRRPAGQKPGASGR